MRKWTRGFAWQARYIATGWPGWQELKVYGFVGAQVNRARFARHLQYAGTSDWYFQSDAWFCVAGTLLCDRLTWAEGTQSVWFLRCTSEHGLFCMAFTELWDFGSRATVSVGCCVYGRSSILGHERYCERGLVWQAQYFLTCWPERQCLDFRCASEPGSCVCMCLPRLFCFCYLFMWANSGRFFRVERAVGQRTTGVSIPNLTVTMDPKTCSLFVVVHVTKSWVHSIFMTSEIYCIMFLDFAEHVACSRGGVKVRFWV